MITPHQIETCQSGDITLSMRRFGQPGELPLLFVHGLSYFSYDWVEIGARLASDREACAMDMRGFGDSSPSPSDDYKLPSMAGDLGAVLDHLGWQRAIVLGHSMGGRTAAYFAAHHPERVAGLVLVDYAPENSAVGTTRVANTVANVPELFTSIEEAMTYFGADPHSPQNSDQRDRFAAYLRKVPGGYAIKRADFFRDQFRHLLATGERPARGVDMWQVVADLQMPTLTLRGTSSDMFAAETATKMVATNARLKVVEVEAGHNLAAENPDAFYAATRSFITAL